ncbi:hypothetical protein DERP_013098 [Dermatophagoides pteronyssinus]|uniref:Uncharacterized protein n=1 Tax=Dermatophagoides pteronyssinus TaxID=6956 RepID=A0ABQ8J5K8_DERPT|nr:hypothetical protein DERP_013098 [Dermatophagoides pteronyssinus]
MERLVCTDTDDMKKCKRFINTEFFYVADMINNNVGINKYLIGHFNLLWEMLYRKKKTLVVYIVSNNTNNKSTTTTIGPSTTAGNPPYIHNNHHRIGTILLIIGIAFGFCGDRRSRQNRLNRSFVTML